MTIALRDQHPDHTASSADEHSGHDNTRRVANWVHAPATPHRVPVGDRMIRISTTTVVIVVAAVAAYVSYRHAYELIRAKGEDHATAVVMPITVDGLIFAASMTMLDATRRGNKIPNLARWTLGLGITASVLANIAHGIAHGPIGAIIAGWPALALVLIYELLMTLIRGSHTPGNTPPNPSVPGPHPLVPAVPEPAVSAYPAEPGDSAGPDTATDALAVQTRSLFADDIAAGRRPSIRAPVEPSTSDKPKPNKSKHTSPSHQRDRLREAPAPPGTSPPKATRPRNRFATRTRNGMKWLMD
ncbi:DUF2637 domain-containing protein [Actinomadura macra]|uniref:DUF2637 domain-containing protein n=1 Tax=Actinomadura macra TaxID=46164 RepID=UPI000832D731|nr:DUF2637 domain-containing protein [Actinomadura macra]